SFNPMQPRAPFNDAPVDRISPCFVGRDEELQLIANVLGLCDGDVPPRYAVWGMPGLGKSQLALKYANTSFRAGRHMYIIWISATTMEKANQGLAGVLDLLQHPDRHHPDQSARITAARLCLEHSEQYGFLKWLIILDDVTVATVPFLRENLPRQNSHGSILFTTRTAEIAEAITSVAGEQHPVYGLNALSLEQSATLLLTRAGIHGRASTDLDSAKNLASRIGCLPLAVEQAGSYMKRNGLTSASQLEISYDQRGLKEVIGWVNSLSFYQEKSVLRTFTVQFERLGEIDPNFLQLLKVLAFFDPESIPLDIVVLGAGRFGHHLAAHEVSISTVLLTPQVSNRQNQLPSYNPPNTDADVASEVVSVELRHLLELICSETWLRGALRHFEDLSLAQPHYDKKISLHIHDLIQLVLQQTAPAEQLRKDSHFALAGTLLCKAFQTIGDLSSPRSWTEHERFVPHLMALLKHAGTPTIKILVMSRQVARYFQERGRYDEAEALFRQALAGLEQQLGTDHPDTLRTANGLAFLYYLQGRLGQAEAMNQRVLAGQEQLGAGHSDTLHTVHDLAVLYQMQGNYKEAESFYQRALAGRGQQLGVDHPATLNTVNALAGLYTRQGNYENAAALYQRALAGQQQQLGTDHPSTLSTVDNLAFLYDNQGHYDAAESLYQRALAGQEQQLGADHPATLNTVQNLAALYMRQGNYENAAALYRRALAGQEQQLGADHPDTLNTANNLAVLYTRQENYDDAAALCQRALAGQEQQLGADHPSTLSTVNNLAVLYSNQGYYSIAKPLYQRALAGQEHKLGADHPDTLHTASNLASLYSRQGNYDNAVALYQRAMAGQEKQLGTDHPSTLSTVHNLAVLYSNQGYYDTAEPLYQRALAGQGRKLGADHPDSLRTTNNLARLYEWQGRIEEAEMTRNRAGRSNTLAGLEQQLGTDHPDTLCAANGLAFLYRRQGRFGQAEPMYQRVLAGQEQLGADHPDTLNMVHCLGPLYSVQGNFKKAESFYQRALAGPRAAA
ncbi:TPR-like protein, partial [Athelia psychrophila]